MSHAQHKRDGQIMSNCPHCRAALGREIGEEEVERLMIKAAKQDATSRQAYGGLDLEAINEFAASEEAQWFVAIENLDMGSHPTVWMRLLAADFMAKAYVLPRDRKRQVRVTATGKTIKECLENLASGVAAKLYPG